MIEKETILEEVAKMFNANGIKPVTMDYISMDMKISRLVVGSSLRHCTYKAPALEIAS